MAKKQQKIKKYRKPLNFNIGMIIFGTVFVYVVACVIMYFQSSPIVRYEVKEGSLATSNIYRGVALRQETVVNSQHSGYVFYYATEGERVAKDDLVYVVDETGNLSSRMADADTGENSLSERELKAFQNEIVSFMHGFDSRHYAALYDFKHSLSNTVQKLSNNNILQELELDSASMVNRGNAPMTGIVSYWLDGYENLTAQDVTEAIFDQEAYEKTYLMGNALAAAQDPVYKLSTAEEWSVVIPVDAARGAELEAEKYIKVRFLKNQYESWGEVALLQGSDGKTYLELRFNNSMITFVSERFLDVELILHDETGLKIPNSSIVEKEFFLVDDAFVTEGSENGRDAVIRQCYLEDGSISSEVLEVDVYSHDEEEGVCYLDASVLKAGDILYKLDSQETFTVSKRATLIGVYNMNKGYADFKEIQILYQNEEYAIVKANTRYGLNVYDYIVLNAESVTDNQFINQGSD